MTSKNPLDNQPGGDGGGAKKGKASDPSSIFEQAVDLQSTTNEIEKSLEELGNSIEETISKSSASSTKELEPPHFTLATSPTRRTHKDE